MKQANLTDKQKSDLLQKHKCPYCGSYDIIFYNPNLVDKEYRRFYETDVEIQTEIECNDCPMYVIFVSKLKTFYSNREE